MKLCIQYIFTSFDKKMYDSNKFIIAMYHKLEEKGFLLFLDEWYDSGRNNVSEIFRKYNYNEKDVISQTEFDKHKEWMKKTKIIATPTVLYNGYELPSQIYKIEDLLLLQDVKIS